MTLLRRLDRADLPALLSLQHAFAGPGPRWTADRLERELHDPARGHGSQVVVAERGGAVVGAVAWVEAGTQLFGAPFLASDSDAAAMLLDHLLSHGRAMRAATLRVSTTPLDAPKVTALSARQGTPLFDFVTVARPTASLDPLPAPAVELRRAELSEVPVATMRALYNETFAEVPNAPPLEDEGVEHALTQLWAPGSGVWLDPQGEAAGFIWAVREHDGGIEHAVVDSVGVRSTWRGRRIGSLLVAHLLAAAAQASLPETRAMIASTNEASLALHRAMGFSERSRITVWELRPAQTGSR